MKSYLKSIESHLSHWVPYWIPLKHLKISSFSRKTHCFPLLFRSSTRRPISGAGATPWRSRRRMNEGAVGAVCSWDLVGWDEIILGIRLPGWVGMISRRILAHFWEMGYFLDHAERDSPRECWVETGLLSRFYAQTLQYDRHRMNIYIIGDMMGI